MGLDWMVNKQKPKPGHEAQFQMLCESYEAAQDEKAKEALAEDLEKISISVYEAIGAPRIGYDEAATAWFKRIYDENHKATFDNLTNKVFWDHWSRPFDAVLEDHKGEYVVELAEDRGGVAKYSGMFCSSLDFRGKAVAYIENLNQDLYEEAYIDHQDPKDALAYADDLEDELETKMFDESDEEVLESAIAWLRFWGSRGFGFSVWY